MTNQRDTTDPDTYRYTCPKPNCTTEYEAIPVPNLVRCGECGEKLIIYAIN